MSTFNNFVQCRVTTPITAVANSIGLYAAVPPYSLPSEEGGLLVLTDSPTKPSKLEVISYTSRSALGLYGVTRGLEGTTAQAWTGPVYCYQSLLAGEFKTLLDSKVDKVTGKQLSDENYTQDEKTKLAGLDTALAGKASITDSRFTDTREWSATTITQAEAEAGTATTRKAWSSQRVRQAANSAIAAKNGIANGIASLDANAKIPLSQLSDSIIGQVEYMGLWNASTNTPTLPTTPAQKGQYYVVNASGTQFGHSFAVGDWIISNGASWDKVDNTDAVSSVNGRTGNVTGLAESTDTRFADSREWTGATISQEEAEAGTKTTRRAFTAQRVRQAIVAWAPETATRWPTWAEVTGKPATFAAASHTHSYLPLAGGKLTGNLSVTGTITASSNITAYSDIKLKENIELIPDALAKINTLHGYTYNRKDIEDKSRHTGVIAQEVQKVLPEAVVVDEEGTLSVAYGNMVGLLIEAIKELKAEVDRLKVNHKEDT